MRILKLIFLAILPLLFYSCSNETTPAEPDNGVFKVSGNIEVKNNKTIPNNARVVVMWGVTAGSPDKMFMYGSGTINKSTNTFSVSFLSDVPLKALNQGNFGLGLILLTTNQQMKDGDEFTDQSFDETEILGVVAENALIYIKGEPNAVTWRNWAEKFKTGYNVGQAVWKDQGFDEYEPKTSSEPILLIIDDLKNIKLPNWT